MLGAAYTGEVYRIENDRGLGPYASQSRTYEDPRFRYESSNFSELESDDFQQQIAPYPYIDFTKVDKKSLHTDNGHNKDYSYGFPSIAMMKSWFPESILRGFSQNGFFVKKYTITGDAFLSKSKRQIAFKKSGEGEVVPWAEVFGVSRDLILCDKWGFPRIRLPKYNPFSAGIPQGQLATDSGKDWCLYQTKDKTIIFSLDKSRAELMRAIQFTSAVTSNYVTGGIYGLFNGRKTFYVTIMDRVELLKEPELDILKKFDPSVRAEDNILTVCSKYSSDDSAMSKCKDMAIGQEMILEELKSISIPNPELVMSNSLFGMAGSNLVLVLPYSTK
jgi:hypothetical protein